MGILRQIKIRVVSSPQDWDGALSVRREVFIEEQGVSPIIERDDKDNRAIHVIALYGNETIGTARLTIDREARIGRVAVTPTWRRKGVAGLLLDALENEALKLGFTQITLHSQSYVNQLYLKHGYIPNGQEFQEADINHTPMVKRLANIPMETNNA